LGPSVLFCLAAILRDSPGIDTARLARQRIHLPERMLMVHARRFTIEV
jgi:hypothetical protein